MTSAAPHDAERCESARRRPVPASLRRLAMVVLGGLGVLGLVVGGTMLSLYLAATAEVPEYEAVVTVDPAEAEQARRELESQLAALASDTQALPEWTSRITARQINAWLALRLRRDFPGFAKAGLIAPRVVLKEDEITVAARSRLSRVRGVVMVTVRPRVTEAGELALQVASATIGRLTLPIDALLAQLRETPLTEYGPIRLARGPDGAAVVVDLERLEVGRDRSMRLTGVDVRDGELLLRGESVAPAEEVAAAPEEDQASPSVGL